MNKQKKFVIFHPFAQKPTVDGFAPNCTAVEVADVITSNKFFGDWSRGVVKGCGFCGGSKIALSH